MKILISILIGLLLLTACSQTKQHSSETIQNPTAEEILTENSDADIFQFKGIIYTNASKIEWVQQSKASIGKQVGKITKQYKDGIIFEDEMASKLPIDAEIFESGTKNGPILIIKINGKETKYLGLIEG
jgi:hypothetical protein